jgi:TrmH family RNA methyltransferase
VTGLSANKIKWIRSLQQKKFRDELGLFVIEGEKLVSEALTICPSAIELIIHTDRFSSEFRSDIETIKVSENDLKRVSSLQHPQGCLAVLKKNEKEEISKSSGLILVLDSIQDPGNMGTILRIADWFGIKQVVSSPVTVDCYNPKVVQASMGAVLRISIHYTPLEEWLRKLTVPIYGALLEGKNIYKEPLPNEAVIIMGNEGNGISEQVKSFITHPVTIPSFGGSESLNVAVATGIIVSEFRRS